MAEFRPRAIETRYNGYLFRSRLEARWAVFMDAAGVPYMYEPEGYELLGGLRYLPDFWLPDQDCFMEVKATPPAEEEATKAGLLALTTHKPVMLFWGDVKMPAERDWSAICYFDMTCGCNDDYCACQYSLRGNNSRSGCCHDEQKRGDGYCCSIDRRTEAAETHYYWCECSICGMVGIEYMGDYHRLPCDCGGRRHKFGLVTQTHDALRFRYAYTMAQEARFEFGKTRKPEAWSLDIDWEP